MLKRKEFILGAAVGLTFAAAATAGGVISWPGAHAAPAAAQAGRLVPSAGAAGLAFAPPQGAPLSFADIFQQVAPAVVQIDVKTRVQRPNGGGFLQIPGFGAVPIPGQPRGGGSDEDSEEDNSTTAQGAGSGFFISADGFIVTNNHVVADAIEINVKLSDGRELKGRLVGRDEGTDLAVIKVDGEAFPFVSFEETAAPRVGDWVIAVGNPFGLGGSATAGIVSAMSRDIDPAGYNEYLQIDAAINRGNSGGPTFDIYGRVIGVNTAIFSPTGGSVGIGFAIPAATAKSVTDRLMRGEKIERGFVGLGLRTLSEDGWEALGQPRNFKGALVETVTEGAPASRAGAQIGDLLVSVNGEAVANSVEATRRVGAAKPGDTIRLEVIRDGRRQTLNVRAGVRPSEDELAAAEEGGAAPGAAKPSASETVEGLGLTPLTAAARSRYSIPESVSGLVVTNVAQGSSAARLGFQPGFVITRANTQTVSSAADLRAVVEAAKQAGRPSVLLFVRTPQGTSVVPLPFAKSE
ncbi:MULTISPECIES: trypsin-like peptidase domain-containing protein [unclassified Brevundimonas]|uniref:trypsin-like peptidase domain-containing protein n=1 Tax=unclassified Brevundimonas TaxID=2622653 RepID=UPI0025C12CF3|nr:MULTISPECIES: trypsin-like peptidase domain-containing protein [unclassified Brevundimonas]